MPDRRSWYASLFPRNAIIIALAAGMAALLTVLIGLHVMFPGTPYGGDPRQFFVVLGAALSGPIGGLLIGFMASILDPIADVRFYTILQHMLGALWVGWAYRRFCMNKNNFRTFILSWFAILFVFFFGSIIPVILSAYYFAPLDYRIIAGPTASPPEVWYRIFQIWMSDFIFTLVFTTALLLVVPPSFRRAYWGTTEPDALPRNPHRALIGVRLTSGMLVLIVLPIIIISSFLQKNIVTSYGQYVNGNIAKRSRTLANQIRNFQDPRHLQLLVGPETSSAIYTAVITASGNYAAHPDTDRLNQSASSDFSPRVYEKMLQMEHGSLDDAAMKKVVGVTRVVGTPFIVLAIQDRADIWTPFYEFEQRASLQIVFSVLLVAAIGSFLILFVLVKPLHRLSKAIEEVRTGNYYVNVDTADMTDEIGMLGESFNSMANHVRKARADLEVEEGRFRALNEHSPLSILQLNLDGCCVYANSRWQEISGLSSDESFGNRWQKAMDLEDRGHFQQRWNEYVEHNMKFLFEGRICSSAGITTWVQCRAGRIRSKTNEVTGFVLTIADVTERKRARQAIEESEMRYWSLFNSAADAIFLMEGDLFIDCNSSTLIMFGCTREDILDTTPYRFSPTRQPDGRDSKEKALEVINAALNDQPQLFEWKHCKADGSLFDAEVRFNRVELSGKPHILATVRDITERKHAEKQLHLLAHTVRSINESIVITDIENTIFYVNPALLKTYGYSEEEVIGKNISFLRPQVQADEENDTILSSSLQGGWKGELLNKKKDGTIFPIALSTSIVYDERNDIIGLIGIFTDITEQKRSEEALRASEEQHRLFLENFTGIAYQTQPLTFKPSIFQGAIQQITGYSAEDFEEGRISWDKLIYPEDVPTVREEGMKLSQTPGYFGSSEYRLIRKDGSVRWVQDLAHGVQHPENGTSCIQGAVYDITDHHRAEEKLRESEHRYRLLFQSNPNPMWVYDLDNLAFLDVNDAAIYHYGYSREEFLEMTIIDIRPPEDVAALLKNVAAVTEGIDEAGIWRHRLKDGELIDVEITSHTVDYAGRRAEVVLAHDVTIKRRSEEALRSSQEQLQKILQTVPDGVVMVDAQGRITFANPTAERTLGLELSSIADRTYNDPRWKITAIDGLSFPEHDLPFIRVQNSKAPVVGIEHAIEYPDGERIILSINAAPLFDSMQRFSGMIASLQDITTRKRMEKALANERNLLQTLIDTIPDAVYIKNTKHQFLAANITTAIYMKADKPNNLIGACDHDFYPSALADTFVEQERTILTTGTALEEFEEIRLDSSGKPQYFLTTKVPLRDNQQTIIGLVGITRDTTEQRASEQALRESEMRYRTLIDNLGEGICTVDSKERILFANPAAEEIFGVLPGMLNGASLDRFLTPDQLNIVLEQGRLRQTGERTNYELEILRPDGGKRYLAVTGTPVYDHRGQFKESLGVFRDITKQKEAEEEQRNLEAQLAQAQKMEAIGKLAGGIAHDFNNILHAILGNAEVARLKLEAGHPIHKYLDRLLQAAERARELVQQILIFSRKQEITRRPSQIQEIIKDALKLLRPTVPSSIKIVTELQEMSPVILVDPGQINQVLMNLCANAVHAIGIEGGTIKIKQQLVTIRKKGKQKSLQLHEGDYVVVSFIDSGHGMDKETMDKIFEPFFTTKGPGQGTGLGLAVVLGIMNKHEGTITVESSISRGSTFSLYFPVTNIPAAAEEEEKVPAFPKGAGEKILFVDDEQALTDLMEEMLPGLGYKVITYRDPEKAWQYVQKHPQEIDALISDFTMPGMTGMVLASKIHALRPELPIIIVTGFDQNIEMVKAGAIGIRDVLLKPYRTETIAHTLQKILRRDQ
ncbi:MAG: PAS domain S-box protein [bacterium]